MKDPVSVRSDSPDTAPAPPHTPNQQSIPRSPRAAEHARELLAFQGEPKVIGQWFASARSMARDYLDAVGEIERLEEQLRAAHDEAESRRLDARHAEEQNESLRNACEQGLLLVNRGRFDLDPEVKVMRAVFRSALASSPARES